MRVIYSLKINETIRMERIGKHIGKQIANIEREQSIFREIAPGTSPKQRGES
jgi:hypothetical protein